MHTNPRQQQGWAQLVLVEKWSCGFPQLCSTQRSCLET